MRRKNSKSTRRLGCVFIILAVLCIAMAIFFFTRNGSVSNLLLTIISGALWLCCGIMVIIVSGKQKEEEENSVKITAFNYAKKNKKQIKKR